MAHWLFKSEPDAWSWTQQKARGAKGEPWSGVRNHTAKLNMMAMKKGERGFFYHSVKDKCVAGIVEVIGEFRPDPTDESGKFGLVIVKAVADMPQPVTLEAIKANPALAEMMLVKHSRLSVQPVRDEEWDEVCRMGGFTS